MQELIKFRKSAQSSNYTVGSNVFLHLRAVGDTESVLKPFDPRIFSHRWAVGYTRIKLELVGNLKRNPENNKYREVPYKRDIPKSGQIFKTYFH